MTQILPALFFPHSPKTSKSKEKGKDVVLVCMYACYQSLRASVHLLQSYGPYRTRPRLASLPLAFLRLWPPRQATANYRAPTKGTIVFMGALSAENPGRSPSSLLSELTASLQKGLNACSLIIWILVNWINCWMETVLLKMTKTQGQGEQKGGLISFLFTLGLSEDMHRLTHTHTLTDLGMLCLSFPLSLSLSLSFPLNLCFSILHTYPRTHRRRMWPNSEEWALGKVQITMRTAEIRTKPIFKAQNKMPDSFWCRKSVTFSIAYIQRLREEIKEKHKVNTMNNLAIFKSYKKKKKEKKNGVSHSFCLSARSYPPKSLISVWLQGMFYQTGFEIARWYCGPFGWQD